MGCYNSPIDPIRQKETRVRLKAPGEYLLFANDESDSSGPGVEILAIDGVISFYEPNPEKIDELRQLVAALNIEFRVEEGSWPSYAGEHATIRLYGPCQLVEKTPRGGSITVRLLRTPGDTESYIQLQEQVKIGDDEVLIITLKGSFDTSERVAALKALGFEEVRETE